MMDLDEELATALNRARGVRPGLGSPLLFSVDLPLLYPVGVGRGSDRARIGFR